MLNDDGEPLLMGSDVAKRLGYKNPAKALRDHVDDEDKLIERIVLSGQRREVILINESGLYSLILSFSRICNPAASNIRIFNPSRSVSRIANAYIQCGRKFCLSNSPHMSRAGLLLVKFPPSVCLAWGRKNFLNLFFNFQRSDHQSSYD